MKKICEISAFSWLYYKEVCYEAPSQEYKIRLNISLVLGQVCTTRKTARALLLQGKYLWAAG